MNESGRLASFFSQSGKEWHYFLPKGHSGPLKIFDNLFKKFQEEMRGIV